MVNFDQIVVMLLLSMKEKIGKQSKSTVYKEARKEFENKSVAFILNAR